MKYSSNQRFAKRRLPIVLIIVIAAIGILLISSLTAASWYYYQLRPASNTSSEVVVLIPSGSSIRRISTLLAGQGVIKNAHAFEIYIRLHHLIDTLQAGQYSLDPSDSTPAIIGQISQGLIKKDSFTILPGQRLDQIRANLIKAGFSQSDVDEALKPENYPNSPALATKPAEASLEGYLYPETFQTNSATKPNEIIEQSLNEMSNALTHQIISGFEANGLTPYEGITLASIVIKEANSTDDRKMVAGVFYNRLAIGMMLGSDVTYQYIADITGQPRSPLIDSPYNTRKYTGLPPGPISNVNQAALEAVAYPTGSDYLFFVAGDDGTIYYSKTAAEHDALAAQYCKVLCSTY